MGGTIVGQRLKSEMQGALDVVIVEQGSVEWNY
jgi:hypothetical protein